MLKAHKLLAHDAYTYKTIMKGDMNIRRIGKTPTPSKAVGLLFSWKLTYFDAHFRQIYRNQTTDCIFPRIHRHRKRVTAVSRTTSPRTVPSCTTSSKSTAAQAHTGCQSRVISTAARHRLGPNGSSFSRCMMSWKARELIQ